MRRRRDGCQRDGARCDLRDGVELPECRRRVREQRDGRVPDDQLDLYSRYQRRGCLRSEHCRQHCFGACGTDGSCDGGVCRILRIANRRAIAAEPMGCRIRRCSPFGRSISSAPGVGPAVATANDSANIAELTGLSAASLAANGLSTSSTVGQWRATVIAKLGSATASQSVLAQ